MGDNRHPSDGVAPDLRGRAAPCGREAAAPFVCGFLVALALYVGFSPLRVQATPNAAEMQRSAAASIAPKLSPDMFRDDRRLTDVSWRVRDGQSPATAETRRALPAARSVVSPPMRLRLQ